MRCVIQRTRKASVEVAGKIVGEIQTGLLVLVGFTQEDAQEDYTYIIRKILQLRIFNDANGVMNQSVVDVKGEILLVSQFTLYAATKKGNRPSYIRASPPERAKSQYEHFCVELKNAFTAKVATGIFAAHMHVTLENDGPVTLVLDSKNREF